MAGVACIEDDDHNFSKKERYKTGVASKSRTSQQHYLGELYRPDVSYTSRVPQTASNPPLEPKSRPSYPTHHHPAVRTTHLT